MSAPTDIADLAVRNCERRLNNFTAEQRAATFNEYIGHDAALLLAGWAARDVASYLSRNSSIPSLRKSGRARRRAWEPQPHQASRRRRSSIAWGKRRLIGRAGLPPTIV